jgi:hypothetical protein
MAAQFGQPTPSDPAGYGSPNPPSSLMPADRVAEIAYILAGGLLRLMGRKSSGKMVLPGESSLDFSARKSGHPTPLGAGGPDG